MIHRAQCDALVTAVHAEFCNDSAVAQLKSESCANRPISDFKARVEALLHEWKAGMNLHQLSSHFVATCALASN